MAAPTKKVARNKDFNNDGPGSGSESDSDENQGFTGGEEIQVTFEGRSPIDSDFHGIKQLLKQLFLKAHLNLSDLTDIIISQSNIGSVVKQSSADEDMEDDDDEEDYINDVFGVTTVINITQKKHLECVQQLRTLLSDLADEYADDRIKNFVNKILSNDNENVGLIINERFVNIPSQISVPLLQGLNKEIKIAKDKKLPYDFQHYILISKLYKTDGTSKKKKNKPTGEPDILWSNAEEEVFDEECDLKFEFSVKAETDSGLVGGWMEDDATMTPFRKVLIISADKMDVIINKINSFVN